MVRAALDALTTRARSLQPWPFWATSRNSPFAEWKFFVRGLAAYYRHDDEAMRANWDRLAPDRFAARLAAPLRRLADPAVAFGDHASAVGSQDEFRQAIRILEIGISRRAGGLVSRVVAKKPAAKIVGARPSSASAAGRRIFRRPCPVWPSGSIACSTTWRCARPIQCG